MTLVQVRKTEQIVEALRSAKTVRLAGSDSAAKWRRPVQAEVELRIESGGIVEHDVEDQVVVVTAGTSIAELQDALARAGQCLPLGQNSAAKHQGTVGGQLSLALPHSLQAQCGSWRDWVLGLTIVRPDGTVAKCGSKAVKNVAGYDVAKLFIGGRGTLGVISEVILRTYPLRAVPEPDYLEGTGVWTEKGRVQKVLRADFETARKAYSDRLIACHPRNSTLFFSCQETDTAHRFPEDWQLGWGLGETNIVIEDPTLRRLMNRSKTIMDSGGKLNPGEFF